ncbi:molybdopterin-dependent oxidoreductase [Pseudomonas nitroreducens]|uniref:xanthine dehydrogenase family protein molybdopterin-binding subunit n=1 Tax=Pseudomonas TaxID=286 RepID=UPI0007EE29F5|nr:MULTISPECIES: molybdopterin cofactor-binding domain-containing protein [Pseudomonas]MCJ1882653.1 molybdopterin-dependent oxidoreductase [Pseudomonas nitroreducens]MCJ1895305.1 molybdopterin-dependent oxidoreductase [Pseudomonas nitroreducens]MDG9856864.1 molybdopterin-dependent oxidoreductase [Pseudomonas nitroreducens]MDH1072856.1 molybdopterin-dependent oxidoreductase [Pseudomonas nitroreducens]NMZ72261.1 xanthine dehydrogenase family protein molybdopterin-binding subunit [Pseudomonas nit
MSINSGLSRRGFLQGSIAALTLAVTAKGLITAAWAEEGTPRYGADGMSGGTVDDPLIFVSIAADGTVTIVAHRAEMGTGVRTSLPMVVADEMEARWEQVRVVQAEADEIRYGNQNVDGSRSVRHFLMPMRRVGAAARQMLEAAAAARWSVPLSEVKAIQHEVVHERTGRRVGYGELAVDAAKQPVPDAKALRLKDRKDFRYIGKDQVRLVDLEAIGKGQATYGMDMRLPGMVYAVVARPPVVGGRLRRFDASKALAVAGVLKVVEIPAMSGAPAFQPLGGLAVVARNTWAARQGRDALQIEWDDGGNGGYDSGEFRQTLAAAARTSGKVVRNQGDVAQAWSQAPENRRLVAEYHVPHLAHASMEPPVATVRINDGKAEVWTSVQNPVAARDAVAARLKLKPENIRVNVLLLGGGFGRKSKPDFVDEAAVVAQAMPEGTPVKLVWTREDDIRHDYLHTVSVERLEAVIDSRGQVSSWLHRSAAPTIASLFTQNAMGQQIFESAMSAINMPYRIPNVRVETAAVPAHARIGWFRSVANIPHAFAAQCFIAELALRAGKDHREFALDLIGPARRIDPGVMADTWNYTESPERYPYDTGRLRAVIEAACAGAGWGRKLPEGHGLGLAFCYSFLSYTATVVEVAVDDKGEVHVLSVDMAIDCGPQIKPERIRAQLEGGAIMGLSLALLGEITFAKGRVVQSNFHDYEVLRHNASPRTIRTHLVNDDHHLPPGGVGEPPVPPVAPALCNAIFAATGKRVRSLPVRKVV